MASFKKTRRALKRLAKSARKSARSTFKQARKSTRATLKQTKRTARTAQKSAKALLKEGTGTAKALKKDLVRANRNKKRFGGVEVSFIDNGLEALLARVQGASPVLPTEVGVIGADDKDTAYIARVHELGLGRNPRRSFLRSTLARGRRKYTVLAGKAYQKFLDGKWSLDQAAAAVAIEIVSDIQATILRGISPRLARATVAAKRRAGMPKPETALFASGTLFDSIRARLPNGDLL